MEASGHARDPKGVGRAQTQALPQRQTGQAETTTLHPRQARGHPSGARPTLSSRVH